MVSFGIWEQGSYLVFGSASYDTQHMPLLIRDMRIWLALGRAFQIGALSPVTAYNIIAVFCLTFILRVSYQLNAFYKFALTRALTLGYRFRRKDGLTSVNPQVPVYYPNRGI